MYGLNLGYGYGGGSGYIVAILLISLLGVAAQASVKNTFKRYSTVAARSGVTAEEAARIVMEAGGVYDVRIARTGGNLTDNYNPNQKTLNLSQSVYGSRSVSALGVAAHEAGHAVQHAQGYLPLMMRNTLVPAVNLGSKLSMPLLLIGLMLNSYMLAKIGVYAYGLAVAFQCITLPVELNASRRALRALTDNGLLQRDEEDDARRVLRAAASTYVVAALSAVVQLLRLLSIVGSRNNRRR